MKVAMIGQKGVPATHGGVERHVEELGSRLAARGVDIRVYVRPAYSPDAPANYRGMELVTLPTVNSKHLDAIVHSFLATIHAALTRRDIVHYHAIGPALMAPLARVLGMRVVCTIHGQDWRRGKWGRFARFALRLGERSALRVSNRAICVSQSLAQHYCDAGYGRVTFVPNGITLSGGRDPGVLAELGLQPGGYVAFIGRLVPEKGLHHLVAAYRAAEVAMPLVVVGDTSHSDAYVDSLRAAAAGLDVRFVGYQYAGRLMSLFEGASLFVLPSDLEGLPIVLLEAVALGVPVLASDIAPDVEVLGEDGHYFRAGDVEDLAQKLVELLGRSAELRVAARAMAEVARQRYDWDRIAAQTERVYTEVEARS